MANEDSKPVCDLVLEGGVTSALIYTRLIAKLSRHYRFKSFGGTSSGAGIAAAGAIAERGRRELLKKQGPQNTQKIDPEAPFDALNEFPDQLAKDKDDARRRTRLLRLFQPQARTARSFRVFLVLLKRSSKAGRWAKLRSISVELLRSHPVAAAILIVVGAIVGAVVCALIGLAFEVGSGFAVNEPTGSESLPSVLVSAPLPILAPGLLLGAVLGLLSTVVWAAWRALDAVRANHFGLCNGMDGEDSGGAPALTPSLHTLYSRLLGKEEGDDPVCFFHLWGPDPANREIDLQVITTALNLRRPYRVPNDPGVEPLAGFLYDPGEWSELFPSAVMDWLAKEWRQSNPGSDGIRALDLPAQVNLRSLPPVSRLPILVAVRMSIAFPGLLSAVPMYKVEWKRGDDQGFIARRVYFADGGITSNCPVHLFDAPLPRHPTFVVSLDDLPEGTKDEPPRDRIFLQGIDTEDSGAQRPAKVHPLSSGGSLRGVRSFVWSIVDTAINWRDSLQRTIPGSEERIAIVKLAPGEGRLNLHMDACTIRKVADLGIHTADKFIEAFDGPRTDGRNNAWDRHRWIRMRSTIAAARRYLRAVRVAEDDAGYVSRLANSKQMDPRFGNDGSLEQAIALLKNLSALGVDPSGAARLEPPQPGTDPASTRPDVSYNEPKPASRLHISSPW
jgi:predicted acylesterase/phospholipase RssA